MQLVTQYALIVRKGVARQLTFGDKIKLYRIDNYMSQDELAKLLGTSKQVLSRYENNQRTPKITVVQEYAEKLGLPLSYLIDDNQTSYNTIKADNSDPAPPKDQPADDPYFGLSPKVAAELRKLDARYKTVNDGDVIGYNGLDISQVSPRAQAELERIKKLEYDNGKKYVYQQIDNCNKKAAVIGYDNGVKSEFFLDEQETRVVLNLIKSLRGE